MKLKIKLLVLLCLIVKYNNTKNRHYLKRKAVMEPRLCPWYHLLYNGDDMSLLEVTGLTKESFLKLYSVVPGESSVEEHVKKRGRPSILDGHMRIGLVLFYVNSTLKTKHLCTIFGLSYYQFYYQE